MKHNHHELWTGDEDRLLIKLIERHGHAWKNIMVSFPHRSASSIRNRHARIVDGVRFQGRNKCKTCGKIRRGHTCITYIPPTMTDRNDDTPTMTDRDCQPSTTVVSNRMIPMHLYSQDVVETLHDLGFNEINCPNICF